MTIHQVLKRTGPEESHIMPHLSIGITRHLRHPAEGGVPHNLNSKHPKHGSDAPAVSWSVSENGLADQVSAGTAGSRKV
ncbi:hypothetical protein A2U01_0092069 [Trifolium medium]|uniref:Uncharacterized protein n=1 Tax=Trifolium medium TaxID=97028 RepID=A0A392UEG5_9FABA|nr:hypothetical protein [Trifolium medium]